MRLAKIAVVLVITACVVISTLAYMAKNSRDLYYKIPNFQLYGQQFSEWCWVASLQMVNKEVTGQFESQKDIFNKHSKIDVDISKACKESTGNLAFNNTLGSDSEFIIDYFKKIKIKIDRQDIIRAPTDDTYKEDLWEEIKTNLLSSKPIILNGTSCSNCPGFWSNHTLVSTGFFEFEDQRFLLIQDPWKPLCEGCQYYLSFNNLWTDNDLFQVRLNEVYLNLKLKNNGVLESILSEIIRLKNTITAFLFNRISGTKNRDINKLVIDASAEIKALDNTYRVRQNINSPITVVKILNKNNKIESYLVRIDHSDGTSTSLTLGVSNRGESFFVETVNAEETMNTGCLIRYAIPNRIKEMILIRDGDNVTANINIENDLRGGQWGFEGVRLNDLNRFLVNPSDTSVIEDYSTIIL